MNASVLEARWIRLLAQLRWQLVESNIRPRDLPSPIFVYQHISVTQRSNAAYADKNSITHHLPESDGHHVEQLVFMLTTVLNESIILNVALDAKLRISWFKVNGKILITNFRYILMQTGWMWKRIKLFL